MIEFDKMCEYSALCRDFSNKKPKCEKDCIARSSCQNYIEFAHQAGVYADHLENGPRY